MGGSLLVIQAAKQRLFKKQRQSRYIDIISYEKQKTMSVCDPCQETQLIPVCVDNLDIGAIAAFNTPVYVYVKNITTGRVNRFNAESDGAGEVIVTSLDTAPDFMPEQAYELWITLQSATSIEDKELITIVNGASPIDCLSIRFNYVEEDKKYASITISA